MNNNGKGNKAITAYITYGGNGGKFKPIIDKVFSFFESIEAFTLLASGRAKGKIVIKISP